MKTFCCAVMLLVALSARSYAQEQLDVKEIVEANLINDVDQSTVALHPATPFLESSSLLLVQINLEKIELAAMTPWLSQLGNIGDLSQATQAAEGFLDSLKGAGVSNVYLTAATRSPIDGGPVVVIPCQNPDVVNGLANALMQQARPQSLKAIKAGEETVVAGTKSAVERVVAGQGDQRPDLILALRSDGLLDHTAVISLPSEAREELQAFWPEQFGAGLLPFPISPRQLVADVSRIVVSVRLPPKPEMIVRLETTDASAADRVKQLIDQALALQPEVQSTIEVEVEIANVNLHTTPDAFIKIVSTVIEPAQKNARHMQRMNDFKQVGLAMHNYYSVNKHLPPRCLTDTDGSPLLSWRVAILPYLEQAALYNAMKLDQAWDSDANRVISSTVVPTYGHAVDPSLGNMTTMRAPVFPGSLWEGEGPPKEMKDVRDGLSNTIWIIEAPRSAAVAWASPEPWVISADDPMSDVFADRQRVIVGMMDGAVMVLDREGMTNEKLKAMLTIAGGEVVEW